MRTIVAIDQGTTGSRALAYNAHGACVASAYQEFRQHFPRPGWVEHDPRDIAESVQSCLARLTKKIPARSIAAIGITNQRETTVLWERSTGRPIANAIVWQCRRTAPRCASLQKDARLAAVVREKTGLPIDAYFSATKIEWLLRNTPGALERARRGELCFGTTDSWVLWNLTAGKSHATDLTNASRTMLFDINRLRWDAGLLSLFSIPQALLPQALPSSGNFGITAKTKALPAGIPITGIAGDQQAALFGQACFAPGQMKNTYGTGSFILLNTGRKRVRSRHGLITTLGCAAQTEAVYVLEGSVFIAGAAIQWLRDGLKIINAAPETEQLARSIEGNDGVYFVPALVGLGAPHWNPQARGLICGITRGTNRAHLARAALEAICYQTRDVLEAMRKDSGLKLDRLKIDGGAAANDFLCQFQADILGIPVVRPTIIETTARGAAYLAGLGSGYWENISRIGRFGQQNRTFIPRMKKNRADELYRGWKTAVGKT